MSTENTISLNLDDYLTDEDKRQIAITEFREVARAKSQADFERILSHAAYHLVHAEVDAVFDGKMAETVKEKAVSVIAKMSEHSVFRAPDALQREASKGWTHLQASIDEAAPLIRQRVAEIIEGYDSAALRELIEEQVTDAIITKLTAPAQETKNV